MKLWSISMRNLRIRLVSTVLTTIAIAVATGLYAAIMLMAEQTRDRYEGSIGGYQAVLGPKDCSQLELLLNTIFHVGDEFEPQLWVYDATKSTPEFDAVATPPECRMPSSYAWRASPNRPSASSARQRSATDSSEWIDRTSSTWGSIARQAKVSRSV